jgi:hypothetical protein
MAKIALLCLLLSSIASQAQSIRMSDYKTTDYVIRINNEIPQQRYFKPTIPIQVFPSAGTDNSNVTYWQGSSYTAYSNDGRF